jgi:hypothetical protein
MTRQSENLQHEVLDDTVEVEAVVEAFAHQRQEVASSDRHLIGINFRLENALVSGEDHDLCRSMKVVGHATRQLQKERMKKSEADHEERCTPKP